MNKNIRIAKQLVKIARNLAAGYYDDYEDYGDYDDYDSEYLDEIRELADKCRKHHHYYAVGYPERHSIYGATMIKHNASKDVVLDYARNNIDAWDGGINVCDPEGRVIEKL